MGLSSDLFKIKATKVDLNIITKKLGRQNGP